jgi:hypothetical protein
MSDAFEETPQGESAGGTKGPDRLAQLQEMIDEVAHHAAPVLREIAAKAAELAAAAATQAGPLAQKAAGATQSVGDKVAARSKEVAADLRRAEGTNGSPSPEAAADVEAAAESAGETPEPPSETPSA